MKTKHYKQIGSIFLTLSLTLFLSTGHAQTFLSTTVPPFSVSGVQHLVQNTGNTVVTAFYPTGTDDLYISCWDGYTPSFSYISNTSGVTGTFAIQGTGMGLVTDPDIVADPSGGGHVVIVYLLNGQTTFESWRYTGTTYVPNTPPVNISAGGMCSNPNIDQTEGFISVMVWSEGGTIYGVEYDFFANNLGPLVDFSACIPGDNWEPDVSVYDDGVNNIVNVVFVHNPPGSQQDIYIQKHDLNQLMIGVPVNCNPADMLFQLLASDFSDAWTFRRPRIASVPINMGFDYRDCQIVFEYPNYDIGEFYIGGINHNASVWGPDIHILTFNLFPPMSGYTTNYPVVSYNQCGEILVEMITQSSVTTGFFGLNVTGAILDNWGDPSSFFFDYPLISNTDHYNRAPSVAGRYFYNSITGAAENLSTYYDEMTQEIMIKSSECGMPTRKENTGNINGNGSISVYPNPTNDVITLRFDEDNIYDEISIIDIHGKKVRQFSQISITAETGLEIDISDLSGAAYIVKLIKNDEVIVKQFQKIR